MTHWKCGGKIRMEKAPVGWKSDRHQGIGLPSDRIIDIGRCLKCRRAGIVCEPPK